MNWEDASRYCKADSEGNFLSPLHIKIVFYITSIIFLPHMKNFLLIKIKKVHI